MTETLSLGFLLQSVSKGGSNWTADTKPLSVNSTMFYKNRTDDDDDDDVDDDDDDDSPLWIDLMDQSQLVMTIVGLIGNIATSITLIKNGQVGGTSDQIK